jgi:RNA recognition motif-containing protein
MSKELFVGNIDWGTSNQDLQNLFSKYGDLEKASVVTDRETGRSRGFGFVKYKDEANVDLNMVVSEMNGYELNGRKLVVNEARPKRQF